MKKSLVLLLLAILIGAFIRTYELLDRYYYTHDSDLAAWIVKDMVIDGHPRLIGQLTSSPGLFIGPLFYYLLVPIYFISGMEPAATLFYSVFIGLFSIFSTYYVTCKIWGANTGRLATLLYAASYSISLVEREVVPTTPIFLWTIWYLYSLHLLFKGQVKGLLLSAVLFSLVWHIQLTLGLLVLLTLGVALRVQRFSLRQLVLPVLVFLVLSSPLALFEIKHDFSQTRSLFSSFGSGDQLVRTPFEKSIHVLGIVIKNANAIFWERPGSIRLEILPGIVFIGFIITAIRDRRLYRYTLVFLTWLGLFTVFFIRHPINLSEYYLNGVGLLWIVMAALVLARLKTLGWIIVVSAVAFNLYGFVSSTPTTWGFLQRTDIVDFIAFDSRAHGYPCVSVSYMVDPGNDLGYRFLFYKKNLHVNRPDSGSPVYTIVFPHGRANRLDFTFGSLGLVLPDYDRYTKEAVTISCSGANSNLTDPMFGFTN